MFKAKFSDQIAARNALVQRRPRRRSPKKDPWLVAGGGPPVKRKRKPRLRRSRSRKATRDAEREARVHAAEVQAGVRAPPKRNQVFLLNPEVIGLEKHGVFWYNTTDPESFYFMNSWNRVILDRVSAYFSKPGMIERFHKARSMDDGDKTCAETPGQRSYENFFTFHCKQNRVVRMDGDTVVDIKSDFGAMLTRFGRKGFDSFCRGNVVVFDAPASVVQKWQVVPGDLSDLDEDDISGMHVLQGDVLPAEKPEEDAAETTMEDQPPPGKVHRPEKAADTGTVVGAETEEPAEGFSAADNAAAVSDTAEAPSAAPVVVPARKKTGIRPMLATNAAQLNFFHWIFEKEYDEIIEQQHEKLHKDVNQSIKQHKRRKEEEHIEKRMELTRRYAGSFVVDHGDATNDAPDGT